ncbi:MAG: Asp-tRNA(Asn)/Glu-tRNA(Gln) amidotransferase subunit GatC [Candidatus Marinimicrobia bacterium]|nr:Asp-tRNA(Asn)/Glu-tRNA(Gln) amidotransferase subunit GatC [Candidatus Neomarinimicrobiota bacterium]MCF7829515.1 Asp-tRNA(Asn)/Glu-tRNA(Gln) amidotransferase subunit GatC [Candidatus Neomarinimicrobiota bacterium]MCF7880087.1 Asp-tRNA(Asn)/Glu-tRNA(Gln) amidotransferase subunit GatC [Candidatus Neomarinimicrobiota bacterium]
MSISLEQVEHIATLAKLRLTDDEKSAYTRQLGDILDYIEKLEELDTSEVEPLSHVMDVTNAFREDESRESLSQDKALENAPKSDGEFFVVPKVI